MKWCYHVIYGGELLYNSTNAAGFISYENYHDEKRKVNLALIIFFLGCK